MWPKELDSPDINDANFEEVLGMFENDIVSILVSVYDYWWYIIIEKLEQYMPVYMEKYSL